MIEQPLGKQSVAIGRKKVPVDLHMSPKDDSVVEKAILNYLPVVTYKNIPNSQLFLFPNINTGLQTKQTQEWAQTRWNKAY